MHVGAASKGRDRSGLLPAPGVPEAVGAAAAIAGVVAVTAVLTHLAGRPTPMPLLGAVAVVAAAIRFGAGAALLTAVVAGLAMGPLQPVNAATGYGQSADVWVLRLFLYVLVGLVAAVLSDRRTSPLQGWAANVRDRRLIRAALDRGEFSCLYQPLFDLATGAMIGVEALVRWNHPTEGRLPPARFIPAAERSGAVIDLGVVVLRQACAQAARWRAELGPSASFKVAVNVSARQLEDPLLARHVEEALVDHGVPATVLQLEVTETALIADMDLAVARVAELQRLGVGIAIDDFGTGQSSLAYLHRFQPAVVKVDRSFVQALDDGRAEAVAAGVIALAGSLDAVCVAEGIETEVQADRLRALGCAAGQGFYYARPLPADHVTRLLPMATTGG